MSLITVATTVTAFSKKKSFQSETETLWLESWRRPSQEWKEEVLMNKPGKQWKTQAMVSKKLMEENAFKKHSQES